MWRIRNFIQFLKDLIYWVPKIWQDRDWDPTYLYQMMRWKIERMRKHMKWAQRHVGWEKDVRDMGICINLLKRCEQDDIYDEMYGLFRRPKCPNCIKEDKKEDELGFLTYNWHMCDPCVNQFKRERKWLDAKQKADRTYLFQLLSKRCDRWWT